MGQNVERLRRTAIPGGTANTVEVLTMKSLAERLAAGECIHCDGGWLFWDDEDGEEVAVRCECRRAGDDLDAHHTSLERME